MISVVSKLELERMLVRDVLYSFQGIDSSSVKKSKDIHQFIKGNIDVSNIFTLWRHTTSTKMYSTPFKRKISQGQANLIQKLLQVGTMYSLVNTHVQSSLESEPKGLICQVKHLHFHYLMKY